MFNIIGALHFAGQNLVKIQIEGSEGMLESLKKTYIRVW